MKGKLFIFEGPDGVGKTTLSKLATELLNAAGQPTKWLSFPGREPGTLGHLVYEVHHQPQKLGVNHLTDAAKQALHIAAHLDAIESTIQPLLTAGTHVVLDRFWWSTWVYGLTSGLNEELLEALIAVERCCWGPTLPSLLLLVESKHPRDRADEKMSHFLALSAAYKKLATQEGTTFAVRTLNNDAALPYTQQALEALLFS
jgi:dTMP kinase